LLSTSSRGLVPGRMQSMAEISYEFIAGMLREAAGPEGMRFFPFVFSLFMFILFCNMLGMVPYFFTVTSHILVTATLALLVFFTVIIYGFYKHGIGFLKLFVPSGVPAALMPMIIAIEVISFLSRPISLSVRLFANMLAGHITLKVFAGFCRQPQRVRVRRRHRRDSAVAFDNRIDRAGVSRRVPAGLCLRDPDLHVPQRRPSSVTLDDQPNQSNSPQGV